MKKIEVAKLYDEIILYLKHHPTPMLPNDLFEFICSEKNELPDFYVAIDKLLADNKLVLTKKGKVKIPDIVNTIKGIFKSSTRGFGFVVPDKEYENLYDGDFYIDEDNTFGAMQGDTVLIVIIPSTPHDDYGRKKNLEGKVVQIVERAVTTIVGTLIKSASRRRNARAHYYVEPDDKKFSFYIEVDVNLDIVKIDDKVEVKITRYPTSTIRAKGDIINVFGHCETKEANYNSILHEHKIKLEFDKQALKEADSHENDILSADNRLDLREKLIFTIDGADAKDLDDAISIEKTASGFVLGVHIADVADYVKENTALDKEAIERGTSVYFVDRVVPMLPKSLSNGICSLNENLDRYTLSAFVTLNDIGEIESCSLHESIISSKIRGVYSELNDVCEQGQNSEFYDKYKMLYPDTMSNMVELYKILEGKSRKRGALELEIVESKILVDDDGIPVDIVKRERGFTERLIEQLMLCANEAVASWLYNQNMPCVYRVHEDPMDEKIQAFSVFAYNLGLDITPLRAEKIRPSSLQAILEQANEKDLAGVVSIVLLRSLMKARYSDTLSSHFGLAAEKYCHFTSPIRRYPDLAVHRIVKTILHGEIDDKTIKHLSKYAQEAAVMSIDNEIRAVQAERDIENLYKAIYLYDKIGEACDGIISSITSFGFFVELENTCEGLVPISSLVGYYVYDEKNLTLSCGQKLYKLGDHVKIQIENVDIITRKIDFSICNN